MCPKHNFENIEKLEKLKKVRITDSCRASNLRTLNHLPALEELSIIENYPHPLKLIIQSSPPSISITLFTPIN